MPTATMAPAAALATVERKLRQPSLHTRREAAVRTYFDGVPECDVEGMTAAEARARACRAVTVLEDAAVTLNDMSETPTSRAHLLVANAVWNAGGLMPEPSAPAAMWLMEDPDGMPGLLAEGEQRLFVLPEGESTATSLVIDQAFHKPRGVAGTFSASDNALYATGDLEERGWVLRDQVVAALLRPPCCAGWHATELIRAASVAGLPVSPYELLPKTNPW